MRKWYLASSPRPQRSSRGGSVASASRSHSTAVGCQNAPDEVLALGQVHAGLAADGGVDHAEQRGGHVHDGHAPVVAGGREPGDVGDDAAADGDDDIAPGEAPAGPAPSRGPRWSASDLACLAVADVEALVLPPRVDLERDAGLGDDGDALRRAREHGGELAPRSSAHEHRVADDRRARPRR